MFLSSEYLLNSFSSPHLECIGRVLLGVVGQGDEECERAALFMLPLSQFHFVTVSEGDE